MAPYMQRKKKIEKSVLVEMSQFGWVLCYVAGYIQIRPVSTDEWWRLRADLH